jgi:hypothetical protein
MADALGMRGSPAHADSHPQKNEILCYSAAKSSEITCDIAVRFHITQ